MTPPKKKANKPAPKFNPFAPGPKTSERTGRRVSELERVLEKRSGGDTTNMGGIRDSLVNLYAKRHKVNPDLALAVSRHENSRGIPWAVGNTGDVGLMQVNPKAHGKTPAELADPDTNVDTGVGVLASYLKKYKTVDRALRAYNGALKFKKTGDEYVTKIQKQLALIKHERAKNVAVQGNVGKGKAEEE